MRQPWYEIVGDFEKLGGEFREDPKQAALSEAIEGVAALAFHIANGRYSQALFGWTSMHDLCLQQTDVSPGSGPYLRVSPKADGMVEFRYLDTAIPARQWHRQVPPDATVERFSSFLDQLGWFAPSSIDDGSLGERP